METEQTKPHKFSTRCRYMINGHECFVRFMSSAKCVVSMDGEEFTVSINMLRKIATAAL